MDGHWTLLRSLDDINPSHDNRTYLLMKTRPLFWIFVKRTKLFPPFGEHLNRASALHIVRLFVELMINNDASA